MFYLAALFVFLLKSKNLLLYFSKRSDICNICLGGVTVKDKRGRMLFQK